MQHQLQHLVICKADQPVDRLHMCKLRMGVVVLPRLRCIGQASEPA